MKHYICHLFIAALVWTTVSGMGTGRADAVTINFDTFPDSTPVPDRTVITTQYASLGVTFSSTAPAGGPTAGVFADEASSRPNALIGLDPATQAGLFPIVMDLTTPFPNGVHVTLISVGNATVTATAFASDRVTVLDIVSVTHGPGAGNGLGNKDPITLHGPGIARVRFEITQPGPVLDGFGIDDVVFSSSPTDPVCNIQLNKASFINGDQVIAQVLRVANTTATPLAIEFKFWFEVPGSPPVSFARGGAEGAVVLPAGFNQNVGPLTLFTVGSQFPRGTYAFNCRFLHPVTGGLQAEDLNPFDIR